MRLFGGKLEHLSRDEFLGLALRREGNSPLQALHNNLAGALWVAISLPAETTSRINSRSAVFTRVAVLVAANSGPSNNETISPGFAWEIDIGTLRSMGNLNRTTVFSRNLIVAKSIGTETVSRLSHFLGYNAVSHNQPISLLANHDAQQHRPTDC